MKQKFFGRVLLSFLRLLKIKKKFLVSREGFTLIELLVVVSIIGLLASVVMVALNSARAKSRDAKRIADISQMQKALEMYYDEKGYYPQVIHGFTSDSSCAAPVVEGGPTVPAQAGCGHCNRWCYLDDVLKKYMSKAPREPMGSATWSYYYAYTGNPSNNYQTYGLMAILETSDAQTKFAQTDGGYFSTGYEAGPQPAYCMSRYAGQNADWLNKTDYNNVCYGGN